jgi:hypothetical protein
MLRLRKNGMNNHLKQLLSNRIFFQWLYDFASVLDVLIPFVLDIIGILVSPIDYKIRDTILVSLSLLAMLIRVTEPFVWSLIKQMLGFKNNSAQVFDNMLVYFVNSNMNLEYVTIILKGVQLCIMDDTQNDTGNLVANIQGVDIGDSNEWDL